MPRAQHAGVRLVVAVPAYVLGLEQLVELRNGHAVLRIVVDEAVTLDPRVPERLARCLVPSPRVRDDRVHDLTAALAGFLRRGGKTTARGLTMTGQL